MIKLVNYNAKWVDMFNVERNFLHLHISQYVVGSIEHVGSTAVKGMIAKPIIDIMVGVKSLHDAQGAINILSNNSYCYYPYKADVMHWFCKPSPEVRTHHLHLVPYLSTLWYERIAFRNILRNNPDVALQYADLKVDLANRHIDDREAYTQKKWPFIKSMLSRFQS